MRVEMETDRTREELLALAGAAVAALGALLPWLSGGGVGLTVGAAVALPLALAAGATVGYRAWEPADAGTVGALGLAAAGLAIRTYAGVDGESAELGLPSVHAGPGIAVTLVGAVLLVVAAAVRLRARTEWVVPDAAADPDAPD